MTSILLFIDPDNPPKVIRHHSDYFPDNSGLRNVTVVWEVGLKFYSSHLNFLFAYVSVGVLFKVF